MRTDTTDPARGPAVTTGQVFSTKQVGAYQQVTIVADQVAARARPGAVVSLAVGGALSAVVGRRAFAVHRVRAAGVYGGTVEIVVDPTEAGAAWVAALAPQAPVQVIGPVGRPFALPKEPVSCALVGFGIGAAPLFGLAEQLRQRRCAVHMVLGAAGEQGLFGVLDARRSAQSVTVATTDGSVGIRGDVTQPLRTLAARNQVEVVYAAGPAHVMHSVSVAAGAAGAWMQALVDVAMPCGTGVCGGCVVPVRGDRAGNHAVRACVDGPVLPGDRVDWDVLT